jgi:hypothetical protein
MLRSRSLRAHFDATFGFTSIALRLHTPNTHTQIAHTQHTYSTRQVYWQLLGKRMCLVSGEVLFPFPFWHEALFFTMEVAQDQKQSNYISNNNRIHDLQRERSEVKFQSKWTGSGIEEFLNMIEVKPKIQNYSVVPWFPISIHFAFSQSVCSTCASMRVKRKITWVWHASEINSRSKNTKCLALNNHNQVVGCSPSKPGHIIVINTHQWERPSSPR